MAGDWIKMRSDLAEDPAVIRMAATLELDEFAVVGRLHAFWSWIDRQSRDGHAIGVTHSWLDRHVQRDGFAAAMVSVGWLQLGNGGLSIPNFDRHNGETAKTRALAANRKQKQRAGLSRSTRDENETREEKRREEETHTTATRRKRSKPVTFMTEDWQPSRELNAALTAECPGVDVTRAVPEFRDYWIGRGEGKADWNATFRNRIRAIHERNSKRPATHRRAETRTGAGGAAATPREERGDDGLNVRPYVPRGSTSGGA
jgi:hypothetical protein